MNKKSGFTLAEVLVTLMIIGVIAAMTIPSLMQSTAQQEYKTALKKAVSMLNQAITMNYALDGIDASDSNYTGAKVKDLLIKRLNVMSQDGSGFYTADGMYFKTSGATATHTANTCSNASESIEDMNKATNICSVVNVDVNGRKGPNRFSPDTGHVYDMYTLAIYPQKVLPDDAVTAQVLYMK